MGVRGGGGRAAGGGGGATTGQLGGSSSPPPDGVAAERVEGLAAGSLLFFAGRLSLHRVSPVVGPTPRVNAILTYEKRPGAMANPYSLEKFFGRTAAEQRTSLS